MKASLFGKPPSGSSGGLSSVLAGESERDRRLRLREEERKRRKYGVLAQAGAATSSGPAHSGPASDVTRRDAVWEQKRRQRAAQRAAAMGRPPQHPRHPEQHEHDDHGHGKHQARAQAAPSLADQLRGQKQFGDSLDSHVQKHHDVAEVGREMYSSALSQSEGGSEGHGSGHGHHHRHEDRGDERHRGHDGRGDALDREMGGRQEQQAHPGDYAGGGALSGLRAPGESREHKRQVQREQKAALDRQMEERHRRDQRGGGEPSGDVFGARGPGASRERRLEQQRRRSDAMEARNARYADDRDDHRGRNRDPEPAGGGDLFGAKGPGASRERRLAKQREHAAALEAQIQAKQRGQRGQHEPELPGGGDLFGGHGRESTKERKRRQQREHAAALEAQIRDSEARKRYKKESERGGGGDVFGGAEPGASRRRRREAQQSHAAALDAQIRQREHIKREREEPGGGDLFGAKGPGASRERRRRQQAEHAAALDAQIRAKQERGGGHGRRGYDDSGGGGDIFGARGPGASRERRLRKQQEQAEAQHHRGDGRRQHGRRGREQELPGGGDLFGARGPGASRERRLRQQQHQAAELERQIRDREERHRREAHDDMPGGGYFFPSGGDRPQQRDVGPPSYVPGPRSPPLSHRQMGAMEAGHGQFRHALHAMHSNVGPEQEYSAAEQKRRAYKASLEEQIRLKNERKAAEKAEQAAYERKLMKDISDAGPRRRGGAGEPYRDADGNIVATYGDLNKAVSPARGQQPPPQAQHGQYPGHPAHGFPPQHPGMPQPDMYGAPQHPGFPGQVVQQAPPQQPTSNFGHGSDITGNHQTPAEEAAAAQRKAAHAAALREQIEDKKRRQKAEEDRVAAEEAALERRLAKEREEMQKQHEREEAEAKAKAREKERLEAEQLAVAKRKQREDEARKAKEEDEKAERKAAREREEMRLKFEAEKNRTVRPLGTQAQQPAPHQQQQQQQHGNTPRSAQQRSAPPTQRSGYVSPQPQGTRDLFGPPTPAAASTARGAKRDIFGPASAQRSPRVEQHSMPQQRSQPPSRPSQQQGYQQPRQQPRQQHTPSPRQQQWPPKLPLEQRSARPQPANTPLARNTGLVPESPFRSRQPGMPPGDAVPFARAAGRTAEIGKLQQDKQLAQREAAKLKAVAAQADAEKQQLLREMERLKAEMAAKQADYEFELALERAAKREDPPTPEPVRPTTAELLSGHALQGLVPNPSLSLSQFGSPGAALDASLIGDSTFVGLGGPPPIAMRSLGVVPEDGLAGLDSKLPAVTPLEYWLEADEDVGGEGEEEEPYLTPKLGQRRATTARRRPSETSLPGNTWYQPMELAAKLAGGTPSPASSQPKPPGTAQSNRTLKTESRYLYAAEEDGEGGLRRRDDGPPLSDIMGRELPTSARSGSQVIDTERDRQQPQYPGVDQAELSSALGRAKSFSRDKVSLGKGSGKVTPSVLGTPRVGLGKPDDMPAASASVPVTGRDSVKSGGTEEAEAASHVLEMADGVISSTAARRAMYPSSTRSKQSFSFSVVYHEGDDEEEDEADIAEALKPPTATVSPSNQLAAEAKLHMRQEDARGASALTPRSRQTSSRKSSRSSKSRKSRKSSMKKRSSFGSAADGASVPKLALPPKVQFNMNNHVSGPMDSSMVQAGAGAGVGAGASSPPPSDRSAQPANLVKLGDSSFLPGNVEPINSPPQPTSESKDDLDLQAISTANDNRLKRLQGVTTPESGNIDDLVNGFLGPTKQP